MLYNNGKTAQIGDLIIVKQNAGMVAGRVDRLAFPYSLYATPNPAGPEVFAPASMCLLQSDVPFGTPPPTPPL